MQRPRPLMSPAKRTPEATEQLRGWLIDVAMRLVTRDGPGALTMRTLAAEAGCAVGLPYKVFASRDELVVELVRREFVRLRGAFDDLVAAAGTGTVGDNLGRYAEVLLGSPAVGLAHGVAVDHEVTHAIDAEAGDTGVVDAVASTVTAYLAAEKRLGRVDAAVDEAAFGFLVGGAVHNLLASGDLYPKPTLTELKRMLGAVASRLAPAETE